MKMKRPTRSTPGFTLVEMMMAAAVSSMILAAIAFAIVGFQRMFRAGDQYFRATADQLRVVDSLGADLRSALAVTVAPDGTQATLSLPDYINPATKQPRLPTVQAGKSKFGVPTSIVNYGDPAAQLQVTYSRDGKSIVRQQGTDRRVLSRDDEQVAIGQKAADHTVSTTLTFDPQFRREKSTLAADGTALTSRTSLRNTRRDQP